MNSDNKNSNLNTSIDTDFGDYESYIYKRNCRIVAYLIKRTELIEDTIDGRKLAVSFSNSIACEYIDAIESSVLETTDKERAIFKKLSSHLGELRVIGKINPEIFESIIDYYCLKNNTNLVDAPSFLVNFQERAGLIQASIALYLSQDWGAWGSNRVSGVATLAIELWESQTGERFKQSLGAHGNSRSRGKDRKRYKSLGPAFVQGLLEILDPNLRFADIDTGLRKALKQRKTKSPEK